MKIMIQYARDGAANYISHLDMQRAFGRAIRRANVDAEYSKGFNPHIVMSFASPLSVGYATKADYLEVGVAEGTDVAEVKSALNAVMPRDIRIVNVFDLGENKKKLMALNHSALYRIAFAVENEVDCVTIDEAAGRIVQSESYVTEDRKGREVDLVPLVIELRARKGVLHALLLNSSEKALNPAVVARAVLQEARVEVDYTVCREECYASVDGQVAPFSSLAK